MHLLLLNLDIKFKSKTPAQDRLQAIEKSVDVQPSLKQIIPNKVPSLPQKRDFDVLKINSKSKNGKILYSIHRHFAFVDSLF